MDVPTQYPELKEFAQTFDNLVILKPKISFAEVCEKYGFPMISKEVSECVYYAKKYLKSIVDKIESENTILTDRQTDRQTDDNRLRSNGRYAMRRTETKQRELQESNDGDYP